MSLTQENRKHYKSLGHSLKPVVTIAGNGLSATVLAEITRALDDHELIKIKLAMEDRTERQSIIESVCSEANCELVQSIGKIALVYRRTNREKVPHSNVRNVSKP